MQLEAERVFSFKMASMRYRRSYRVSEGRERCLQAAARFEGVTAGGDTRGTV